MIRGGSWFDGARNTRAACRTWSEPLLRYGVLGFRCARGHREPSK
ncbi:MAG: hypothetical protein KTR21_13100 [Rhodobacteraceae bacterium]|nr:hypothetical protein [Paracoccaceae bacterium]